MLGLSLCSYIDRDEKCKSIYYTAYVNFLQEKAIQFS